MTYKVKWSRYVMRYALVIIGISLVVYTAGMVFHYSLRSSGATAIPIVVATMMEGAAFARAEGTTPKGAWAWQQALLFGFVGMAVTMAFSAFFMSAFPGGWGVFLAPVGFETMNTVTVLMSVFFVLAARLFFWMGARNVLKQRRSGGGTDG